ncbi:seven-hairpin glycosidase [Mollisia scopiformis]|uniref:alpha-1,2-Mannosidase n=1 Tax=Mollisia scopiformis TaxID=149040 RepID=A0A194X4K6_MOLSC|nr:seven-hairpin glycosidase [Mollisia scopiformis]KUJ14757.1 seven-hairpin glycosidase [Mollisia scopiformis]
MPKIQFSFNDETPDAKINREKRQTKVKEEFQKAWSGYRKKAWLHDELSPETGGFKDPFCGWAATLVDSLDTLWIMGLQEEFENAARAVDLLDFTTSPRGDIPVFETTIRYLGGLIAAYDVSGYKYKNLLDKAVELAEILLGTFDTPNRMPQAYYYWKPTYASQPKRANIRTNLAELGSLAMEFTRLAQLTGNQRYYDAVARITNALSEWQDRGTALGSVFPENVDASGCNRTAHAQQPMSAEGEPAIVPGKIVDDPIGYQPDTPGNVPEPKPRKRPTKDGPHTLDFQVAEGQPGTPGKGHIAGWEDSGKSSEKKLGKRDRDTSGRPTNATQATPTTDAITGLPLDIPAARAQVGDSLGQWDCHPQGLEPAAQFGAEKFSMGGGQDSTYEYFPKQYLLLGGLEPVYKKMYLKTIEDIKKYMLFRPMTPDNQDILFSGSVTTRGKPEQDAKLSADVDHLTCFIGGMVGMSAKIFGLDEDIEIAKRLTDGCVWAYGSTATGIMPEGATVYPCESVQDCTWNQTAYYLFLDPMGSTRDLQVEDYLATQAEREAEEAAFLIASGTKEDDSGAKSATGLDIPAGSSTGHDYDLTDPSHGTESLKKEKPISLAKRQDNPKNDLPKPITHNFKDDLPSKPSMQKNQNKNQPSDIKSEAQAAAKESLKQKSDLTEAELEDIARSGRQAEMPLVEHKPTHEDLPPDPFRPLNHTEYVEARIKQGNLPPGFVTLKSRKYILRPEAIESVWYMYRITGDPTWQDKGWKMFEAIINATSVTYGHAAVYDVTEPTPYHMDSMESFWLAETLKYFYLLFSTPDEISLDEWVLNTEAHPFKRPS